MQKILIALGVSLALAACNPIAQMNDADALVDEFHEGWNAEAWDSIYNSSSDELRASVTREQIVDEFGRMRFMYGAVEQSSQTGINVNTSNGVTITTITRSTTFAEGSGTETFEFVGSGDEMALIGWEVQADNAGALLGSAARRSAEAAESEVDDAEGDGGDGAASPGAADEKPAP